MAATVDVVIRNVTDLEEVTVTIVETATIRELKEALAEKVDRPEILEVGEILRMLPDGSTAPIKETVKLGIRRQFGFKGCALHAPMPDGPPISLDDFVDFDPDEDVVSSPRSVKACWLEGVDPEDLIYVPVESYGQKRIEPRIAELWYDFFEAMRQDSLKSVREKRQFLIAEEQRKMGRSAPGQIARPDDTRIAGTGGNWCGALEHSCCDNAKEFFMQRNEMCNIDRVYRGATLPYRSAAKGSRFTSSTPTFHDEDPVLAGDTADDAADKLYDLMHKFNRLPNSKKFVEEQRLKTRATGIVQYESDAGKLHKDQKSFRRLTDDRVETSEAQITMLDNEILFRNEQRREMDERSFESKPPKNKIEVLAMDGIKQRAEEYALRRERFHEDAVQNEYGRCDKMQELTLKYQAVEERVHQHQSLQKLSFCREWVKRRIRWQLNNNSITENRDSWNQASMAKHQAAADRVETQHLIRQKWIEYRREIKALKRLYADLAARREKARQNARREMVSSEFSRRALEEATPSPSPMRRSKTLSGSLGSTGAFSIQSGSSQENYNITAPICHLLKQPRVVKRIARFDFPRMGSGFMSSSPTASTRSGNWSLSQPSTMRQSTSGPNLSLTAGPAEV